MWGKHYYSKINPEDAQYRALVAGLSPNKVSKEHFVAGLLTPFILYKEFVYNEAGEPMLGKRGLMKSMWKVGYGW